MCDQMCDLSKDGSEIGKPAHVGQACSGAILNESRGRQVGAKRKTALQVNFEGET